MFPDFSGPLDYSIEADDLFRLVATEHYRSVGERFVSKFGSTINRTSSGLMEYIADRIRGDLSLPTVWRPSFGLADRALYEEGLHVTDPTTIAVELALAFEPGAGCGCDFSFTLPKPTRVAVGPYVIPIDGNARIRVDSSALYLERPDTPSLVLRKDTDGLAFEAQTIDLERIDIERLPQLRTGDHCVLFASEASLDGLDENELPFPISRRGAEVVPTWSEAYSLIAAASPDYLDWVTRAIRSIIPVQAPSGSMVSGSQGHRPSEVYMTDHLEPIKLAEMLVHEASHQYFHIATFLGPVEDGTDHDLYYSPVVERPRPIEKILLAYHAFANVILFLRLCQSRGLGDQDFLESNLRRLSEEVATLQKPLETSRGLTELGKVLWQPLAERLHHAH
jgi:HEXXH motif-containing protein